MRPQSARGEDRRWLRARLDREYRRCGARVEEGEDGAFAVRW
ncbi:hypothetical protein [Vulcaniibacterium gelatinicum]|nr:hypothetical protein [Vulcaniibacterium gelatinicum]